MEEIELPKEIETLAIQNFYEYIRVKADRFLTIGPENYRKEDYFNQPEEGISNIIIELLKKGCIQILTYKGLTIKTAFIDIGIEGFHRLMALFHYKIKKQRIILRGRDFIIDEMNMEHTVSGEKMKLFNKVTKLEVIPIISE